MVKEWLVQALKLVGDKASFWICSIPASRQHCSSNQAINFGRHSLFPGILTQHQLLRRIVSSQSAFIPEFKATQDNSVRHYLKIQSEDIWFECSQTAPEKPELLNTQAVSFSERSCHVISIQKAGNGFVSTCWSLLFGRPALTESLRILSFVSWSIESILRLYKPFLPTPRLWSNFSINPSHSRGKGRRCSLLQSGTLLG